MISRRLPGDATLKATTGVRAVITFLSYDTVIITGIATYQHGFVSAKGFCCKFL